MFGLGSWHQSALFYGCVARLCIFHVHTCNTDTCCLATLQWVTCSFGETPVSQTKSAYTENSRSAEETLRRHDSLQKSKENIYHNQSFSFTGNAGNTSSHCGSLKHLKRFHKDDQMSGFSLPVYTKGFRFSWEDRTPSGLSVSDADYEVKRGSLPVT